MEDEHRLLSLWDEIGYYLAMLMDLVNHNKGVSHPKEDFCLVFFPLKTLAKIRTSVMEELQDERKYGQRERYYIYPDYKNRSSSISVYV